MVSGIYKLIDGSLVQGIMFDNIANNLANINTNAFKRDFISFDKALTGKYTSQTDFSTGPINHTGNSLNVALNSRGFFKVMTPKGVRYTRNGSFTLDENQVLVTKHGYPVMGQNGELRVNGKEISIGKDGEIIADNQSVGRLAVVHLDRPAFLIKEGGTFYRYQGEGESPAEDAVIQQGYLESSNVNPTEEMIKMIEAFRAFESAQKAIQSLDELTSKMINDNGLLQ